MLAHELEAETLMVGEHVAITYTTNASGKTIVTGIRPVKNPERIEEAKSDPFGRKGSCGSMPHSGQLKVIHPMAIRKRALF
jgi:hypothetical protein